MSNLSDRQSVMVFWLSFVYAICLVGSKFNPLLLLALFLGIWWVSKIYKMTFIDTCGMIKREWHKGWDISVNWIISKLS